jgi:hypothetical protein
LQVVSKKKKAHATSPANLLSQKIIIPEGVYLRILRLSPPGFSQMYPPNGPFTLLNILLSRLLRLLDQILRVRRPQHGQL